MATTPMLLTRLVLTAATTIGTYTVLAVVNSRFVQRVKKDVATTAPMLGTISAPKWEPQPTTTSSTSVRSVNR